MRLLSQTVWWWKNGVDNIVVFREITRLWFTERASKVIFFSRVPMSRMKILFLMVPGYYYNYYYYVWISMFSIKCSRSVENCGKRSWIIWRCDVTLMTWRHSGDVHSHRFQRKATLEVSFCFGWGRDFDQVSLCADKLIVLNLLF